MKVLTTATAIAFVALALSPAIAESDHVDVTADPHPLVGEPPTPMQPAPQSIGSSAVTAEEPGAKEVLVTALLGLPAYDPHENQLGEVVDVVLAGDGAVDAVIISVGGFLGIGQKNVAVPFAMVTETTDADGNPRVIVNQTPAELEAAPDFAGVSGALPSTAK